VTRTGGVRTSSLPSSGLATATTSSFIASCLKLWSTSTSSCLVVPPRSVPASILYSSDCAPNTSFSSSFSPPRDSSAKDIDNSGATLRGCGLNDHLPRTPSTCGTSTSPHTLAPSSSSPSLDSDSDNDDESKDRRLGGKEFPEPIASKGEALKPEYNTDGEGEEGGLGFGRRRPEGVRRPPEGVRE
jgi:hypothetical protein